MSKRTIICRDSLTGEAQRPMSTTDENTRSCSPLVFSGHLLQVAKRFDIPAGIFYT